MELSSATRALLTLHLIPGVGPRLTAAMLERFGAAEHVLRAGVDELLEIPHIGRNLAEKIHGALAASNVSAEIDLMRQHGVRVLVRGEADYPAALASVDGAPILLYVAGELVPEDARAIAVVGSRHCTSYGKRVAERLGSDLARAGWTVVSGLARGIDGAAHRGALQAGGRTLAALAGGLSKIYPPEHAELAQQVRKSGALLAETSMRMEPMAGMFPARNRVISGMCRAVVVVEAAEKSGALITARHAAEQGREVFAIPGPVDSPASGGTLKLLRDGARLVRHAGDLLEDLEGIPAGKSHAGEQPKPAAAPPTLTEMEMQVWIFLGDQQRYVDDIARAVAKPIGEVIGLLMQLEMKRAIRRLPGNLYERC